MTEPTPRPRFGRLEGVYVQTSFAPRQGPEQRWRCSRCGKNKIRKEFYERKNGRQRPVSSRCRVCLSHNLAMRAAREEDLKRRGKECPFCHRRTITCVTTGECYKCLRDRGLRLCMGCMEIKVENLDFWKRKAYCVECMKEEKHSQRTRRQMEFFQKYGEGYSRYLAQDTRLRKQYGISLAEYEELVQAQDGRCEICHRPPEKNKELVVDHDHETGEFRGLLCSSCNIGIGYFKDSSDRMQEAADYVRYHHQRIAALRSQPAMPPPASEPAPLPEPPLPERGLLEQVLPDLEPEEPGAWGPPDWAPRSE